MNQSKKGSALLVLLFITTVLTIIMMSAQHMFRHMHAAAIERENHHYIFYSTESLLLYGKKIAEQTDFANKIDAQNIFYGPWPQNAHNILQGHVFITQKESSKILVAQLKCPTREQVLYTLQIVL